MMPAPAALPAHDSVLMRAQRDDLRQRVMAGGVGCRDNTSVVGTAPYMAPEAEGAAYDEKVDIYSAGVTFWELFEQATFEDGFLWAMTPGKARPILKTMGSKDPKERPSAIELIETFEKAGLVQREGPGEAYRQQEHCVVEQCGCTLS